jgi:hypothetical protein
MNSASVVESATMDCRRDIQETAPVPIFTTYALVERPLSDVVGVGVRGEDLRGAGIGRVRQAIVDGAAEVTEEVLRCLPVRRARLEHEAAEDADSVRDVEARRNREVHQRANSAHIRLVTHELVVLRRLRALGHVKARAEVERCGDGAAVRKTEAVQQVERVLALAEVQRVRGAVAVDLDTEEERGGPEVAQLEALYDQALDLGDLLLRLGRERDVVHEDRHDHLHTVLLPDEHRRVRADAGEAQLDEHLLKAAEPLTAVLLEAVEALEQASNPGGVALSETVRLLHVHVDVA